MMHPLATNDTNLAQRFWSKVDTDGDCWIWLGSNNGVGYGEIRIQGKKHYAHRLSYQLSKGAIPNGLVVDHLCSFPSCVNPNHLEAVTFKENVNRGIGAKPKPHIRKKHCIRNHPLSGGNLYVSPKGYRGCLACRRQAHKPLERRNYDYDNRPKILNQRIPRTIRSTTD